MGGWWWLRPVPRVDSDGADAKEEAEGGGHALRGAAARARREEGCGGAEVVADQMGE
jgi:hypothetical protein